MLVYQMVSLIVSADPGDVLHKSVRELSETMTLRGNLKGMIREEDDV